MRFRPCIDLHDGKVKQIIGGSLDSRETPQTNFVAKKGAGFYARRYRQDGLSGGHVIRLGEDNTAAAKEALRAYPGGLQLGGGITVNNAAEFLDAGASHVIVTSAVFRDGRFDEEALAKLVRAVGKDRLVLDLSCRKKDGLYYVVTDRWQKFTSLTLSPQRMTELGHSCAEFLIHGVDVEGKRCGIDRELLGILAQATEIPVTYAGGIASMEDIRLIGEAGQGRIDFTVGSALDLFGGNLSYQALKDGFSA